jgi:hypothetical protein
LSLPAKEDGDTVFMYNSSRLSGKTGLPSLHTANHHEPVRCPNRAGIPLRTGRSATEASANALHF